MFWFALRVSSRNEKRIATQVETMGLESYAPMIKVLKLWSDRKKWVEEPLIKSYVFVKSTYPSSEFYSILQIPGAMRFVFFENKPAIIPDYQIDALKVLIEKKINFKITPSIITPGTPIEITSGPMRGFKGEVVSRNGKHKFCINITSINTAISFIIPFESFQIIQKL